METLKYEKLYSVVEVHQPLLSAVIQMSLLPLHRCRDLACNAI